MVKNYTSPQGDFFMERRDYSLQAKNKPGEVVYGPAVTPALISDLRDIDAEMEEKDDDNEAKCARFLPGNIHQALIVGSIFEALSNFKVEGVYFSNRTLRVLKEQCGINFEIIEQPTEPIFPYPLEDLDEPSEEGSFEDAGSTVEVIPIFQQRMAYNERGQAEARTGNDLW